MTQQHSYCFTHLTDPHLSTLKHVKLSQLINKRILGYLSWRTKRRFYHLPSVLEELVKDMQTINPDHVVISGDLTHIGIPDEFDQVAQWLPTVGGAETVTVIPGNHETYVQSDRNQTFSKWHGYMASDETTDSASNTIDYPIVRIRESVAFIGLNSAYASMPFLATGKLGNQQLKKLAQVLEKTRQQGLFRVVVVHHPPMPGICKWRKRLVDARLLEKVLRDHGAELVLYGHTHKTQYQELATLTGTAPVISVSSASSISNQSSRRASYAIFRVNRQESGQWKLSKHFREYDPEQKLFVDSNC